MTAENGGELVPSIAFQHIIPQEPCEKIFLPTDVNMGDITINFQDGTNLTVIPDVNAYDGIIFEKSCPSYGNDGQWDAMVAGGDVLGLVVGHDHVNNSSILYEGVRLTYGLKLGEGCYYNEDLIGGTTLTIDSTGNTVTEHHYYSLADF